MMGTAHTHTVTFTCARKYVRRRRDERASAQATVQRYWITLPKPMKQESGDQHDTEHTEGSISLRKHTRSEKHTFLSAVIKTEHSMQPKHRTQDRHVSLNFDTMSSEIVTSKPGVLPPPLHARMLRERYFYAWEYLWRPAKILPCVIINVRSLRSWRRQKVWFL